ncbi:hypothetical protein JW979_14120 [bacterium]|nr:hypothetical protein [candidate division CSSED10-310 bacterium]
MHSLNINHYIVFILISFAFISGCSDDNDPFNWLGPWEIRYVVSAWNSYDVPGIYGVRYFDCDGDEYWDGHVDDNEWEFECTADDPETRLLLYARHINCDGPCPGWDSEITVSIFIDGWERARQSGETHAEIDASLADLL